MTVGIGQVLKLLDMIPDKKGRRTFIEKLPSAQKLDGGNLSGLMGQLQGGGLASLYRNPIAPIAGPLQDLIGAVMGAQGGNTNAFAAAVGGPGGLGDAVQAVTAVADRLSGVAAPGAGQFGFTDLALHESVLDQLGASAPAAMALDVAAGPLVAGDLLSRAASTINFLNNAIISGQMTPDAAAPNVISITNEINYIVLSSHDALSHGEAMAPGIAQVQTAAGMLISGSPQLQNLIRTCLQPSAAAAIDAAMTDRLTIRPPDPAT